MKLLLVLLVLLPILLSLVESAPPKTTSAKKGKQLIYYEPVKSRMSENHVENDDEDEDADDDVDDDADDDDADDDPDADDDIFDIPAFDEVFPNPDGRPVGPNSYDAFMKHKPGGQPSTGPGSQQGPAGHGQAGPRVAGQAGPRVSGHAGPGQRRNDPYGRIDNGEYPVSQEIQPYSYRQLPAGAQLVQYIPDDPTSTEDLNNFYPKRDGRDGYGTRGSNLLYKPMYTPSIYNYNRRQYMPYRRPTGGVFYTNRPKMEYYQNQIQGSRPVYNIGSPIRRHTVPMNYGTPIYSGISHGPYGRLPPMTRIGQARVYNPWSVSPLRGDNYNPEYVVNPTLMLSRRRFRYHPSQRMPIQRIPLYSGAWGNPRQIQRDPWTGAHYHGGYLSSQI